MHRRQIFRDFDQRPRLTQAARRVQKAPEDRTTECVRRRRGRPADKLGAQTVDVIEWHHAVSGEQQRGWPRGARPLGERLVLRIKEEALARLTGRNSRAFTR